MKKEVQRLLEKADHALEVAESLYKHGFIQDASRAGFTMRCFMPPKLFLNQKTLIW